MRTAHLLLCTLALGTALASPAFLAAVPGESADNPSSAIPIVAEPIALDPAIAELEAAFERAYNANDPAALAKTFSDTITWVDGGGRLDEGKGPIIDSFRESVEGPSRGVQIKLLPHRVRMLTPDSAVAQGDTVNSRADGSRPATVCSLTRVFVREGAKGGQGGTWKIAALHMHPTRKPVPEQSTAAPAK